MEKRHVHISKIVTIAALLTFCLASRQVMSMEFQSIDEIANTARTFIYDQMNVPGNNLEVSVNSIDRRLRLKACDQQLEAFSPGYGSRRGISTVGVRCNSDQPWSIYVSVTVKVFKNVAVLKHTVPRNQLLTEADIVFEKTDVNRLSSGYFTNAQEITGKMLTQNLAPGTILSQYVLKAPMAIKNGQMVTLIAKNSVIEVRTEGKALSRGAIGDRIKVKNLKTKRIIEGVVLDNQLINVNL